MNAPTGFKTHRLFARMIGRDAEREGVRLYLIETSELDRFLARLRGAGRTGVLVWLGEMVSRVGVSRHVDPEARAIAEAP